MKNFIAHSEEERQEMLNAISCNSVDDLFKTLPIKMAELKLDEPLSEMQTQKKVKALAKKNNINYVSFLGGGVYNKFIPAAIA